MKVSDELLTDATQIVAECENENRVTPEVTPDSPSCAGCGWGCAGIVGD